MLQFALNHMTAAKLTHGQFIDIASNLACSGVEFRNDIQKEVFDSPAFYDALNSTQMSSLTILGLSEISMFNDWNDERAIEVEKLITIAKSIGAKSISLIPRCDGQEIDYETRTKKLEIALREIKPMLKKAGLIGLIEPLGFERSSLRLKSEAIAAIEKVEGIGVFKLVHDTFHHALAGEDEFFPLQTGIVHVSGVVEPDLLFNQMEDAHRILVNADDRLGNIDQLKKLFATGCDCSISFECFSPSVHDDLKLQKSIKTSMQFISDMLADCVSK